jgi:hypothetical protein
MRQPSFNLAYALSRLTPGTNLLAFCTAVGWLILRLPGALLALAAVDDLGLKYARSSRFRRQTSGLRIEQMWPQVGLIWAKTCAGI